MILRILKKYKNSKGNANEAGKEGQMITLYDR